MKSHGGPITSNGIHPNGKPSGSLATRQAAETKSTGSTAEEQKSAAKLFYPKKLGLRGVMPNT